MSRQTTSADWKIDPLYVNQRRALNLAGGTAVARPLASLGAISEKLRIYSEIEAVTEAFRLWIVQAGTSLESLEMLWATGVVDPGRIFRVTRHFFFKNVSNLHRRGSPVGYTKFEQLGPAGAELTLELRLNLDHIAPGSPGSLLSGKVRNITVIGAIEKTTPGRILAVPIVIGRLVEQGPLRVEITADASEVRAENTDSFERIKAIRRPKKKQFEILRSLPESDVKAAFAEILEEESVPKDWGGERSDLFTSQLSIEGLRRSAAFLFKGPAGGSLFRPMNISSHFGKRGDQIVRLASEPADVLIVQHCHMIPAAVRSLLQAIANQIGRQRQYCLIDGPDTYRILKAYRKCNVS